MLRKLLEKIFNLSGSLHGQIEWIGDSADIIPITVNGTATVYSRTFPLKYADNLGLSLMLAGTSPNVTITIEQGAQEPAAANINAADSNFAVGAGVAPVCTALTSKTVQIQTLSLVPMKLARFKIVGQGGNGSDTTVKLGLFIQELIS